PSPAARGLPQPHLRHRWWPNLRAGAPATSIAFSRASGQASAVQFVGQQTQQFFSSCGNKTPASALEPPRGEQSVSTDAVEAIPTPPAVVIIAPTVKPELVGVGLLIAALVVG